jgi:hypothetical protein
MIQTWRMVDSGYFTETYDIPQIYLTLL